MNCLLKHVIEEDIEGTRRRGKRLMQLVDYAKEGERDILKSERRGTILYFVENPLSIRLWTPSKTDYTIYYIHTHTHTHTPLCVCVCVCVCVYIYIYISKINHVKFRIKHVIIIFYCSISISKYKESVVVFLTEAIPLCINRLTPNDPYMGRTAPLSSKHCILYIYSKKYRY